MAKCHLKRIAIRSAKIIGKQKCHERFLLESNLIQLQEKSNNENTWDIESYLVAKEKLKQLDLKDLDAIKIRTKAKFLEEGEQCTRCFFLLEKRRKADQIIRVLTKDNLDTASEPIDLLKETHKF